MCDKTGTLTQNVMRLKKCSVAGIGYGSDETEEFDGSAITECLRKPQNVNAREKKDYGLCQNFCFDKDQPKNKRRKYEMKKELSKKKIKYQKKSI